MTGLDVIKEYNRPGNDWLPMIDHIGWIFPRRNEYDEVNIGWNAGLLGENRPYFAECWATDGITMLTAFVSAEGIEDLPPSEVAEAFRKTGYYTPRENAYAPDVKKITDGNGNEFFSINIAVGMEDETYVDGGWVFPFETLNAYNSERMQPRGMAGGRNE